ncbi:tetratricopeptide repeat protein, partial [Escherichia coli]
SVFQNDLGAMYYIGEIIKKDFVQAKYWFEKSAGQGNNDALLNLALMYRDGKGVNKNPQKAISLYLNAANKNHPLAQHSLACMYRD